MDNNTGYQQTRQFHPFAGLWSGIGDMVNGNKYIPYMTANWAGNGLAKTGIGYIINPSQRDYVSAGQALGASNFKNLSTKDNMNKVLGRLSGIGGNLGAWAQNKLNEYAVGKDNTVGDMNVRIWDNQDYNLAQEIING